VEIPWVDISMRASIDGSVVWSFHISCIGNGRLWLAVSLSHASAMDVSDWLLQIDL